MARRRWQVRRWTIVGGTAALLGSMALVALGLRAEEAAKSSPATDKNRALHDRAAADLVGRRVPSFALKDAAGETRSLADYGDKRAVVLVFLSTECPIANEYLPVIAELASKEAEQSVQWLAVYSSPSDDAAKIAAHVKQFEHEDSGALRRRPASIASDGRRPDGRGRAARRAAGRALSRPDRRSLWLRLSSRHADAQRSGDRHRRAAGAQGNLRPDHAGARLPDRPPQARSARRPT